MALTSLPKVAAVCLLSAAGFLIGWWAEGARSPATADQELSASITPKSQAVPSHAADPPTQTLVAVPPAAPESSPPLDLGAVLDEAERRGERVLPARTVITHFSGRAISSDGTISDAAAELLQLTGPERAEANRAIADAAHGLRQLEIARIEIATASETETVFRIAPFAEEGEVLKTAFREDLRRDMDPEAADLVWEMVTNGNTYNTYWKGWGEEARELRFAVEPADDPERVMVSFAVDRAGAFTTRGGISGNQGSRIMSFVQHNDVWTTFERLAGRHAYLGEFLEEPVRSFFVPNPTGEAVR